MTAIKEAIRPGKVTVWGALSKLSTRTLLMIRSDQRLGLERRYRKTAELILVQRGVPLGEISIPGKRTIKTVEEET